MIPPLDPSTGYLPPGRFPATQDDIEERFVRAAAYTESETRRGIWSDWQGTLRFAASLVEVQAVWLAGSFVSSKLNPGDLDVTFIWNLDSFESLDDADKQALVPFFQGGTGLPRYGIKIDSYVMLWPRLAQVTTTDVGTLAYFRHRGYWDDWWMRVRQGEKGDPPHPSDALARRGYLEVRPQ